MIGENINIPSKPLRVLISPLHWGLGHATRIIPVIKLLLAQKVEVIIAAGGAVANLLSREFPGVKVLNAPYTQISYSAGSKWFFFKMLMQAPGLLASISKERRWVKKVVAENRIDAVISDNRFGFSSEKVPSVFITHQLFINAPNRILQRLAQKINYFYIGQFVECWVPDMEKEGGLAGKLSHPLIRPEVPVHYIGPLSRLKKEAGKEKHILIALSGPEPQRSIWEATIVEQLATLEEPVILVRGLPLNAEPLKTIANIMVYDYADADLMSELMNEASLVISRSGYSTVMDLVKLRKKAILVPTPGQGEQEWLAEYLQHKKMFYSMSQDRFNIKSAIDGTKRFSFHIPEIDFEKANEVVIKDWMKRLRSGQPQ